MASHINNTSTFPQTNTASPATTSPTATHTDRNIPINGNLPQIQNVVASCDLSCHLDLTHLAQHIRNAEYAPKRFSAVVVRIRDPRTTALIFASGKMVITGAKSEDDARLAARKNARIVQKQGYCVSFKEFKIQNIVGSGSLGAAHEGIKLDDFARDHRQFASLEPERFPGLVYHMYDPKAVLLIFYGGKIVITGAKTRETVYRAFEKIVPVVRQYPFTPLQKAGENTNDNNVYHKSMGLPDEL
ncbi:damage-control phosphatase [Physcia stellaris]|nr:damage-control phosphatase [Physcia stellaris]